MRFYATNKADDPGFELTIPELVERYVASDDYTRWLDGSGVLMRSVINWASVNLGGWTEDILNHDQEIADLVLAHTRDL